MNFFQMLQMFRNSNNPMAVAQQLCSGNPQMQELIKNLQGKNVQEWESYARNIAQSKGIDIKQYLSQFGINI